MNTENFEVNLTLHNFLVVKYLKRPKSPDQVVRNVLGQFVSTIQLFLYFSEMDFEINSEVFHSHRNKCAGDISANKSLYFLYISMRDVTLLT